MLFFPIFVSLDYDLIMTHVFQLFLAVLTFLFLFPVGLPDDFINSLEKVSQ